MTVQILTKWEAKWRTYHVQLYSLMYCHFWMCANVWFDLFFSFFCCCHIAFHEHEVPISKLIDSNNASYVRKSKVYSTFYGRLPTIQSWMLTKSSSSRCKMTFICNIDFTDKICKIRMEASIQLNCTTHNVTMPSTRRLYGFISFSSQHNPPLFKFHYEFAHNNRFGLISIHWREI